MTQYLITYELPKDYVHPDDGVPMHKSGLVYPISNRNGYDYDRNKDGLSHFIFYNKTDVDLRIQELTKVYPTVIYRTAVMVDNVTV